MRVSNFEVTFIFTASDDVYGDEEEIEDFYDEDLGDEFVRQFSSEEEELEEYRSEFFKEHGDEGWCKD